LYKSRPNRKVQQTNEEIPATLNCNTIRVSLLLHTWHSELGNSLLLGGCPVHRRMFSTYTQEMTKVPPAWVVTAKNVSRHCQMFAGEQNNLQLRATIATVIVKQIKQWQLLPIEGPFQKVCAIELSIINTWMINKPDFLNT
jgi:hypothetical protein